jgi:hypothetical protein
MKVKTECSLNRGFVFEFYRPQQSEMISRRTENNVTLRFRFFFVLMRKLPTSNYYFEYFDCSYPLHVRQLIRPLQTTSQFFLDCLLPIFTGLLFHHCTSIIGMSVRVSDHQRVLHLTRAGLDSCLHPRFEPAPDPHRIRFKFYFSPKDAPETKKNKKKKHERNSKNPERNPEMSQT